MLLLRMLFYMDYSDILLKTTVIDAKNNKQESFANGSGLTVKTLQYKHIDPDTVLTTLFEYDDVNQLKKVTDDAGKSTESLYDWAGNRTQVKHPASGITTFGYDPAGNTLWKYTANKDSINFGYEYNRLTTISYPRHPENNVVYTYGLAQTSDNRAGRLVGIEDGSGAQEFKYGRQGEVTEVRRTLVIPNQGVASYVTKTEYDSWNRLLKMTYPDGEVVNYSYNTGGLLAGVSSGTTTYVKNILYDKFEQRTQLQYGNGNGGFGAVTTYSYKPTNRLLDQLSVASKGTTIMQNAYTYDDVGNIIQIENTGTSVTANKTISGTIGGTMKHTYQYDNLYRLKEAHGVYNDGVTSKNARYDLYMDYDNMHNIVSKKQQISQTGVQFAGSLNAGYELNYTINTDNSQQIANIADESYRYEGTKLVTPPAAAVVKKSQVYSYDANGNMIYVASGKLLSDSTLQATSTRKLLWDEENRLLAISDNGYVSNYWYDAAGERTVKQSGGSEGVFVNGVLSGARTGTNKFTAYVSPYLVVSNGGNYTKHIYMGSQRITSKVSNSGIFTSRNPLTDTTALNKSYTAKLASLTDKIKERFDSLGVVYNGIAQTGGLISSNPDTTASLYFYHSDHLGSSSLITDGTGALVQHIEYVPFGETFIDERNGNWSTPYLFNGKEKDEETGLHYYGARYYDSRLGVWLSVDPLAEKYPGYSSYVYCLNNPILYIDPDGKQSMFGWSRGLTSKQQHQVINAWNNAYKKATHPILDVFGSVPVVGEPADVINGLLYSFQGDKWNAGMSFAGAIPFFGWAATGAKWISNGLKNVSKVDVKAINKLFGKAPYSEAFDVVEGTTTRELKLVRVHGENNKISGWMMDASEIKGLSPQEIQNKFALPELPTQVSDVLVPSGTQVRIGVAGKVDGWGNGGGVQVQALQDIPHNAFTNTRNLE